MILHLADGVLSIPVVVATTTAAAGILAYSVKGLDEEEIPKISLMTGAFFVSSLISIPVGPTTIHPMLGGLLGLVLGKRTPLGIFIGLLLQAILFQHGGLTTLGANTLLFSLPALLIYAVFGKRKRISMFLKGALAGGFSIIGGVGLLIGVLLLTDQRFGEGFFSVVNMIVAGHIPLVIIEGILTGFAVSYLYKVKPGLFSYKINTGKERVAN